MFGLNIFLAGDGAELDSDSLMLLLDGVIDGILHLISKQLISLPSTSPNQFFLNHVVM
jgi:hypothetical protein